MPLASVCRAVLESTLPRHASSAVSSGNALKTITDAIAFLGEKRNVWAAMRARFNVTRQASDL
tara:strand:- start:4363 stop:4551 length:189 start_codon:yes stop_codon:yes gene_type:complete